MRRREHPIPEGERYDDFVTASYNFRYLVYGPVERGKKFVVPTFPRKGATSYEIRVATREEEEARRRADLVGRDAAYYISLTLDPEVVASKEGLIEGWLAEGLYPVRGTIKDAILFGDVKGRLVRRTITESS